MSIIPIRRVKENSYKVLGHSRSGIFEVTTVYFFGIPIYRFENRNKVL